MGTQVDKVFGGELFRGSTVDVDEDGGDGTVLVLQLYTIGYMHAYEMRTSRTSVQKIVQTQSNYIDK